jgi:hypothetical protein
MKLSEHITHCVQLMAMYGDHEAHIFHREGEQYSWKPRCTYVRDSTTQSYEISRAFVGQFK